MPVAVGEKTGSVIRAVLVSLFFFQVSCKTGPATRVRSHASPPPRANCLLQDRRKWTLELRSAVAKMRISHPAAKVPQSRCLIFLRALSPK